MGSERVPISQTPSLSLILEVQRISNLIKKILQSLKYGYGKIFPIQMENPVYLLTEEKWTIFLSCIK